MVPCAKLGGRSLSAEAAGVSPKKRVIVNVAVEIYTDHESDRVFGQEPSGAKIVVSAR